jgi:hypothetical protein
MMPKYKEDQQNICGINCGAPFSVAVTDRLSFDVVFGNKTHDPWKGTQLQKILHCFNEISSRHTFDNITLWENNQVMDTDEMSKLEPLIWYKVELNDYKGITSHIMHFYMFGDSV